MALNKLYYVFGIDTSCFYTAKEDELENKLIDVRHRLSELKKTCPKEKYNSEHKLLNFDVILKWQDENADTISELNNMISNIKSELKDEISSNSEMFRTLNQNKLYDSFGNPVMKKRVATFDSTLTRAFNLKEREFNTEIIIVKVYFFEIAKSIVKNGFMFNGEKYVFFSSSAGQIRTKKMVCVKENLLKEHWNLLTCGLTTEHINSLGGMNINKYLAYLALCNSATDLWDDFDISKTIVVDDFENNVNCEVDYIDDITYEITRKKMDVPIPHMDGCGLISPDLSKKNFMVRLPWIKGLLGVFDFVKFIKENNYSPIVSDIYGVEHDIIKEDIKIIFTKSQFKMWKYFDNWGQYRDNFIKYRCQAGICNVEDDEFVKATINYQMIQSLLDITDEEIKVLCKESSEQISRLATEPEAMLEVFGATESNLYKNSFQKCLIKYPELLSEAYTRQSLRDIKTSLEKDLWSAKFKVNGSYTFILPDLYAFCEWLFNGTEYPKGILGGNEIHCKLFNFNEEVDCLRSPHLYMEHAIRENVTSRKIEKWFTTNAIYTSCFDIISKILMFDVDGDKALVVQDKTLIDIAKRNMEGVVPLFYDMKKAKCEIINPENLYTGLTLAYTGGNIGIYSNDISKIKNSEAMINEDSKEEALKCIKWLCLENNQTIDYAKTLYKSTRPDDVNEIILKYTKNKLPSFFMYAKDKVEKQVDAINDSPVNRIHKLFPKKRLNFNFKKDNIGKFNYQMLMSNPNVKPNQTIIDTWKKKVCKIKHNITGFDKDGNYSSLISDIKNEMASLGYDETYVCDVLTRHLFCDTNSIKKGTFWSVYRDIVYNNLCKNLKDNFIQCEKCKTRFYVERKNQCLCESCLQKENKKRLQETLKRKELEEKFKIINCVDCGKQRYISKFNNKSKRCIECQVSYNLKIITEKTKEYRKKHSD